jgi:hypothetical protein
MSEQPASPIAVAELCLFLKDMGSNAASFWLTAKRMSFELDCLRARHINWQPIETARHGERILAYDNGDCEVVQWFYGTDELRPGWYTWDNSTRLDPTHWCELEVPSDE